MPRWEFRYLKNAILRDKSIQFSAILTDADASLGGEGNVPIMAFLADKRALYEYDIVILGDVAKYFTSQNLEHIKGFVEERGGSLIVMVAGRTSCRGSTATRPGHGAAGRHSGAAG